VLLQQSLCQQLLEKLKSQQLKIVSSIFILQLNQAVAHAEVEYGDKTEWDLPAADPTGETMFAWLEKYYIPYIKVVRVIKVLW
jgi:hypothetical protein